MSEESEPEEQLPAYMMEGARSGRAKCKTCRRTIDKGDVRLGILVEGPFGTGYMWHHIKCAARKLIEKVEEAYEMEAWQHAKEPLEDYPPIEELRTLRESSEDKRKQRRELPYAEPSPSGRSSCKHCDEKLEKGELRLVLGRSVTFGNQTRITPIFVMPEHAREALEAEDSSNEAEGFIEALRANCPDLEGEQFDRLLERIGEIDG